MNILLLNYILFILIVLLCYIFSLFNVKFHDTCKKYKLYKKILYSNIINQCKAGDLIFFDHTLTSIYERSFGHPQFSHIGLITEINKKYYICDLNPKNDISSNIKMGINLIPIYDRIYNYNGYVYISSLKNKLNNIQLVKLNNMIQKNINFLSTFKIINSYIYNTNIIYDNEMTCIEFTAYILDNLGITNNISKSKKKDLFKNIINLSNSDLYSNPVQIIIDNLIIKNLYNCNYITNC